MDQRDEHHEPIGYGPFVLVWLSLLILTGLTVAVAGMDLGRLSMLTAIVIAGAKAALVFYFFMHLKYEESVFRLMLFITLITITLFIGITFLDVSFR